MRPYLAVIYDSFVEAMSSKVLWALLFGWTLILAGVAPFGFIHDRSYEFSTSEILLRESMVEKLEAAAKNKGTKSQQAVVAAMKEDSRKFLLEEKKSEPRKFSSGRVAELLNETLSSKTMYSAEAWPTAEKRAETKELLAKPVEQLSKLDLEQLNRRLIENAFQGSVSQVNENRIWVGYGGMKLLTALPLSEAQSRVAVETIFLSLVMKIGLGIVAMFVAIIVTSPMVPDMFQPGSLHLLLSKPISRSLLFLSKFAGGCIFVAINIAYLLIGLYFVAGLRLNIWNSGLLLCIPLFVFVFMIFYSVSALTGLIWKNAIVSVIVTGIFWLICFSIGLVYGIMKPIIDTFPQVVEIQPVGDKLFAVRQEGALMMWDEKTKTWQVAYDSSRGGNRKVFGPFWFEDKGELYFGKTFQTPFGMQTDDIKITVANLNELKKGATTGATEKGTNQENPGKENSDKGSPDKGSSEEPKEKSDLWSDKRTDASSLNFPSRTRRAIVFKNTLLVLSDVGLFQLDRERAQVKPESQGAITDFMKDAFAKFAPGGAAKAPAAFKQVSIDSWQPQSPMDFAPSPNGETIGVYHRGQLEIMRINSEEDASSGSKSNDRWKSLQEATLFKKKDRLALVALSNNRWILAGEDCIPRSGQFDNLSDYKELTEIGEVTPRKLLASPLDGSFVLLTSSGDVWLINADGLKASKPSLAGQGQASAIAFDPNGKLVVGHHVNRVDRWDLQAKTTESLARPVSRTVDLVFNWVILPIYWINPKPSAVDDTIQYCLQREESVGFAFDTNDLADSTTKIDPWTPIWSNSIFIAVLLVFGCLYLHRQDL